MVSLQRKEAFAAAEIFAGSGTEEYWKISKAWTFTSSESGSEVLAKIQQKVYQGNSLLVRSFSLPAKSDAELYMESLSSI